MSEHEPVALSSLLKELLSKMAPSLAEAGNSGSGKGSVRASASLTNGIGATKPGPAVPAKSELPESEPRGIDQVGELWQRVVGSPISELTQVKRYRGGVLFVEVKAAPLLAELRSFARDDLLHGLHDGGLTGISDIRFSGY